jgi:hypothetical protein
LCALLGWRDKIIKLALDGDSARLLNEKFLDARAVLQLEFNEVRPDSDDGGAGFIDKEDSSNLEGFPGRLHMVVDVNPRVFSHPEALQEWSRR